MFLNVRDDNEEVYTCVTSLTKSVRFKFRVQQGVSLIRETKYFDIVLFQMYWSIMYANISSFETKLL